jgi:hypothetical protein
MKYLAGLVTLTVALAGFVFAEAPITDDDLADPSLRFRRDQRLIDALVDGGLRLASESDPLTRAGTCNRLADQFAREIEQAAKDNNAVHAGVLAHHLDDVLVRGVAFNASLVKKNEPDGPARRTALEALLRDMDRFTAPAEDSLRRVAANRVYDGESILRPLQHGRAVVQRAVTGEAPGFIVPGPK